MDQQSPFQPGQKFYFTSEPPMNSKPKRASLILPILGAVIAAGVIGMGFAAVQDSTVATKADKPTPTPSASPQTATSSAPSPTATTAPAILPEQAAADPVPAPTSAWNAHAKPSPGDDLIGVYAQPNMQSQLIGLMESGDAVKVLSSAQGWSNIQRGKYSGWVRTENLEARP